MLIKDVAVTLLGLVPPTNTNRLPADMFLTSVRQAPAPSTGTAASSDKDLDLEVRQAQTAPQRPVVTPPATGDTDADSSARTPVPAKPGGSDYQPVTMKWTAEAGRVLTVEPIATDNGPIAEVRILAQGSHGQVSVNPDNTLSLVLSEDPGRTNALTFGYEITYQNGRTQQAEAQVKVMPASQKGGWGDGSFYMLEEDAQGNIVVEHGDNHRKIHVTESSAGLTRAEIAKAEGLAPAKITAQWLADHPEYGATPDKALSTELGMELWFKLGGVSSNWLLFERGHEYADTGRLIGRSAEGESELHPLYVGAYGEGDAPIILDKPNLYQTESRHVVIQGLEFQGGFQILKASNVLLNDLSITGSGMNIQNIDGFTFRNSSLIDVAKDTPNNEGPIWHPSLNRETGIFIKNSEGVLIENTFADRNGWSEGYDYNLSVKKPMPPSMFSHNYYIQNDNLDVTFRDNIVMRAASFGAQLRSGGVIEGNVFLDGNGGVSFLGGNYKGAGPIGNFSLFMDNIISSAAHKRVVQKEGALSEGLVGAGEKSTLIGNIVAHLADPNNAKEFAQKTIAHSAHKVSNAFHDDTIVFNWFSSDRGNGRNTNINIEGLDTGVLNATTIQNFTAQLLGRDTATIADLANHLRGQADGRLDHVVDADLIVAFFQEGFGMEVATSSFETTARFVPNALADGIRWDNKLNWSTGELPGEGAASSVDLGGNSVYFGAQTVTIDDFIFGDFGKFTASSGRLNIEGRVETGDTGARMIIEGAGQVWLDGYQDSARLTVDLSGGRFANTGEFTGQVNMIAGGTAQALLATSGGSFDLQGDSRLTIQGQAGKIGFDGATKDAAVLRMHEGTTLFFDASDKGLGQLTEFRSGAFGDTSQVTSGVRLDGTLRVDLTGWKDAAKAGATTLIDVDQLVGRFDNAVIDGLGARQDALVRIDYIKDEVELVLGAQGKGTGAIRIVTTGEEAFTDYRKDAALDQLWDALHSGAGSRIDDPLL